jgi:hypothetical protein
MYHHYSPFEVIDAPSNVINVKVDDKYGLDMDSGRECRCVSYLDFGCKVYNVDKRPDYRFSRSIDNQCADK